jgi:hypothetical protein
MVTDMVQGKGNKGMVSRVRVIGAAKEVAWRTGAMSRAKDDAGDGAHDGGGCQRLWLARTRRGGVSKPPASLVVRLA